MQELMLAVRDSSNYGIAGFGMGFGPISCSADTTESRVTTVWCLPNWGLSDGGGNARRVALLSYIHGSNSASQGARQAAAWMLALIPHCESCKVFEYTGTQDHLDALGMRNDRVAKKSRDGVVVQPTAKKAPTPALDPPHPQAQP